MADDDLSTRIGTLEASLSRVENLLGLQRLKAGPAEARQAEGNSTFSNSCGDHSAISLGCGCVAEPQEA